jgi:hypothetical protein
VTPVQATRAIVNSLAGWRPCQPIAETADQMTQGVASESVGAQQHQVRQQDESAEADAKPTVEPERIPHVPPQNYEKYEGQIEKIPVDVLQN